MHKIKKYSNRKLYDTADKTYISLNRISELVHAGEEVVIVDSKTGEDLTSAAISQLLARDNSVPSSVLMNLLQKGQGTFQGTLQYARKYASVWQGALTMAEGEIDRLVSRLVKENDLPESEGGELKTEILGYAVNLKEWISDKVDQQVAEVLSRIKPMTKEHVAGLTAQVESLSQRVDALEKALEKNRPPGL